MFKVTGSTNITSISGKIWIGRRVSIIPTGVFTFVAGNNIQNTVTTTPNVLITAVSDGKNWWLK